MLLLTITETFDKRFAYFTTTVGDLLQNITARDIRIWTLEKDNTNLRAVVDSQQQRIEALEAHSRLDNLVVYGLPSSYTEATASFTEVE